MAADKRASKIAGLEEDHAERVRRVDELKARVPDPESVVDKWGRLPVDRRASNKADFAGRRYSAVTDLRQERLDLQAELETTPKGQRRELLARARQVQVSLDLWLGIPEPAVDEVCSECSRPLAWHVWSISVSRSLIGYGPCPAYPGQRAIYRRVMAILVRHASRNTTDVRSSAAAQSPLRRPQKVKTTRAYCEYSRPKTAASPPTTPASRTASSPAQGRSPFSGRGCTQNASTTRRSG